MPDVTCPECKGSRGVGTHPDDYCPRCDGMGWVFQLDRSGKWRGRFLIEPMDDDQWQVVDDVEGLTISGTGTKTDCKDIARFAREYVRRWGAINFNSFPYSLDDEPVEETP